MELCAQHANVAANMSRSTFAFLLVASLLLPGRVSAQTCGDADGNGSVTVTDGVQVLRTAAGLSGTCPVARCDTDESGTVTLTDGVNVLREAAGLSASLHCTGTPCQPGLHRIIDATGDGAGNPLQRPIRIAVDREGNAFVVADTFFSGTGNLFRITRAGVVTEILDPSGNGTGTVLFGFVIRPAVDDLGNVYVYSGDSNARVIKVTPTGVASIVLDDRAVAPTLHGLGVSHLAVDSAGNLYVTGTTHHAEDPVRSALFRRTPSGAVSLLIDESGDGAGNTLGSALDVAVDDAGNAYVLGGPFREGIGNVFRIRPDGTVDHVTDGLEISNIDVDGAGNLYMVGARSSVTVTPAGAVRNVSIAPQLAFQKTSRAFGDYIGISDLRVDDAGTAFVAYYRGINGGRQNFGVYTVSPDGAIDFLIDDVGETVGPSGGLAGGLSLDVDDAGNVYVAGRASHNAFVLRPGACE